jgi:hypothetical protein
MIDKTQAMDRLIKRLYALDAPCRECDFAIHRAMHNLPEDWPECTGNNHWMSFPYTASIDAAMTLVPEALRRQVYTGYADGVIAWAGLAGSDKKYAKELPIAICIAALRAQEALGFEIKEKNDE